MIVIVCLDNQNGMLFNKRRQSQDSCLRDRVAKMCCGAPLWMNAYSVGQFSEKLPNLCVAEDFLLKAGAGEYCFVENMDIAAVAASIERIVIFRWNRSYPADVRFPEALFSQKWKLVSTEDFVGSSHERITQEVYTL